MHRHRRTQRLRQIDPSALLAGAVIPSNGAADLDGIPIAKWQRVGTSRRIGYLPDEPIIIEGTVHENIARFSEATAGGGRRSRDPGRRPRNAQGAPLWLRHARRPPGTGTRAPANAAQNRLRTRRLRRSPIVVVTSPSWASTVPHLRRLIATLGELKGQRRYARPRPRRIRACSICAQASW